MVVSVLLEQKSKTQQSMALKVLFVLATLGSLLFTAQVSGCS